MGHVEIAFSLCREEQDLLVVGNALSGSSAMGIIKDRYPRIAANIETLWGSREMDVYFDRLVVKDREQREGFPPDIMAAILSLSAQHVKRFNFDPFDSYEDIWDPFVRYAYR